jgi:hypothetical protein
MTLKSPAGWSSNVDKLVGSVTYSDPTTSYSSATVAYSSTTSGAADSGKIANFWISVTKQSSQWYINPLADDNLYAYDSASFTYDSTTQTYDGIVSGEDMNDIKTPTAWNEA